MQKWLCWLTVITIVNVELYLSVGTTMEEKGNLQLSVEKLNLLSPYFFEPTTPLVKCVKVEYFDKLGYWWVQFGWHVDAIL